MPPTICAMIYPGAYFASNFPLSRSPNVTAGLIWHPDTGPIAYTIARSENPKANATPAKPILPPARTAAPQPPKTSTNVPISSARYRFICCLLEPSSPSALESTHSATICLVARCLSIYGIGFESTQFCVDYAHSNRIALDRANGEEARSVRSEPWVMIADRYRLRAGVAGAINFDRWARVRLARRNLPRGEATFSSVHFACWPDMQLIRHSHEFSQRFGLHLEHHPSPLNFDCPFGSAEFGACLFVE